MDSSFAKVKLESEAQNHDSGDDGNVDVLPIDEQESVRFAQDTKHRHTLVVWMMVVVSIWLFCVLAMIVLNEIFDWKIKSEVLITLLATTTLNVLGLASIILDGLFGSKKHTTRKKKIVSKIGLR